MLARSIERPADVWLVARMGAWRAALPLLKRMLPLPRLARLMWSGAADRQAGRDAQVESLVNWWYRPGRGPRWDNCLERSLLAYRFLSETGAEPRLLVGLPRAPGRPEGHAWVTVSGRVVGESEETLEPFAPVVAFGAQGSRQEP